MKRIVLAAGVLLAAAVIVGLISVRAYFNGFEEGITPGCVNCDWPTYRNDRYGFELQYPPGSSVHDGADPSHAVGDYFDGTRTPIVTIVPSGGPPSSVPTPDFPKHAFLTVSVAAEIKTEERCRLMVHAGAGTPVRMRITYIDPYEQKWFEDEQKWFDGKRASRRATGTHMQSLVFHTLHAGTCYEVTFNGLAASCPRRQPSPPPCASWEFFPPTFSRPSLLADFINTWVNVEARDGKRALFADGSRFGWGALRGGTARLAAAIDGASA